MRSSSLKRILYAAALATATLASLPAQAAYGGLVVFGDSLSDSGNNYLALSATKPPGVPQPPITPNVAIADNSFIPSLPYLGAPIPVYSNGPVWASIFAAQLGLAPDGLPSLAGGKNFAFGGAVTSGTTGFPFSLSDQVGQFLGVTGGVAPNNYLYVVAGGGNDARNALDAIGSLPNPMDLAAIGGIVGAASYSYANNVGNIVDQLQLAGAKNIVVWNTPDLGAAPAVNASGSFSASVGTALAAAMNGALATRLKGEAGVQTFDLFSFIDKIVANPAAFGLSNVKDACIQGACTVDQYLFWDGIHPTARGHQILAQGVYAQVVPEPETYLLFALGLTALAWRSRKRSA